MDATRIAPTTPTGEHSAIDARVYLSAEQLAARTPWSTDAIEQMVRRGVLKANVHFFQPFGRRSQRLFKWDAIVELIEGLSARCAPQPVIDRARAAAQEPNRTTARIDVEKATTDLQLLLA
jgi:hypothetical protein